MASHQMYQTMANPNTKANAPIDEAVGRVFRHVDVVVSIRLLVRDAFFLHVHEGVDVMHDRDYREVVDGRRGGGRPLQGAAVPGVAGQVTGGMTVPDAHDQLNHLAEDADQDHRGPHGGDDQIGLPGQDWRNAPCGGACP